MCVCVFMCGWVSLLCGGGVDGRVGGQCFVFVCVGVGGLFPHGCLYNCVCVLFPHVVCVTMPWSLLVWSWTPSSILPQHKSATHLAINQMLVT